MVIMKNKISEAPDCPHCETEMMEYELPLFNFSDGLGWGTPYLWICPSDQCPIFRKGFDHTVKHYGQTSSMRSIIEPDTGTSSVIPAFTLDEQHYSSYLKSWRESRKNTGTGKQENKGADSKSEDDEFVDLNDNSYDPNADYTE